MSMKPGFLLGLCALWLAACAAHADAAQVVETYFRAVVGNQRDRLSELSCTAWETHALTTAASFQGTSARLENMQCQVVESNEGYQIVQCQGRITVAYQGEQREFPLGRYRVEQEDGAWRVCGEAS
ncbi:MAG: hypothetical protein K8J31_29455 [Anaerolineae bacterium]|nr:hypothetical protein [Anaerolineae bacterium]